MKDPGGLFRIASLAFDNQSLLKRNQKDLAVWKQDAKLLFELPEIVAKTVFEGRIRYDFHQVDQRVTTIVEPQRQSCGAQVHADDADFVRAVLHNVDNRRIGNCNSGNRSTSHHQLAAAMDDFHLLLNVGHF